MGEQEFSALPFSKRSETAGLTECPLSVLIDSFAHAKPSFADRYRSVRSSEKRKLLAVNAEDERYHNQPFRLLRDGRWRRCKADIIIDDDRVQEVLAERFPGTLAQGIILVFR